MKRKVYHVQHPDIVGLTNYEGKLGKKIGYLWVDVIYEAYESEKLEKMGWASENSHRLSITGKRLYVSHVVANLYPSPEEARARKIFENSVKFVSE